MKIHTKMYFEFFEISFDEQSGWHDFIKCGLCDQAAIDIAHIDPKAMGGRKSREDIYNLIALCRKHHDETEGKFKDDLRAIQYQLIKAKQIQIQNREEI